MGEDHLIYMLSYWVSRDMTYHHLKTLMVKVLISHVMSCHVMSVVSVIQVALCKWVHSTFGIRSIDIGMFL